MSAKILVVDDSTTDRLIIRSMLSEYNVICACDGMDAMSLIETIEDIDLVILDLNMPIMDGFQVLQALKDNGRLQKLRVIILTNSEELEKEIKGLKMGAVDYIRKPVQMESLQVRISIHVQLLHIQKYVENKLYENVFTFDTIFQQAPIGIAISHNCDPMDSDCNELMTSNAMFEQITGRTTEEMRKIGWVQFTHPDDAEEDLQKYRMLQQGQITSYSMEKRFIRPDGSYVWVNMVVAPLAPTKNDPYRHICLVQDITDRKNMENQLKYISEHNMWTDLYNRRYYESIINEDIRLGRIRNRALVGINLSTVNILNVTYGLYYSQELIKKAANTLKPYCTEDIQLFHIYENQFVFYVKAYQGTDQLMEFCRSIADSLGALLSVERISGGIGVIELDNDGGVEKGRLLKELMILSEQAINTTNNDMNISFFNEEIHAQFIRRAEITRELAEIAEGERADRLFLQYQPVVDLQTNQICGFEALARLNSDQYGRVPPLEFIPIAEKTNLVVPLGYQIIHHALQFLERMKESGYLGIMVSINISAIQLLQNEFVQKMKQMLNEMRADPENIVLEITESVFASNYQDMNNILGQLKAYGIRIALDDFGTGYSSLARERELNINCLKIDKYFIDKLMVIEPEKTITGDIISIGHKLGHYIIAEGVEHEKQRQYLKERHCDKIQGYLISKPLDEDIALELLRTYTQGNTEACSS
ncbi:MAG: EAL domain-containing protein [Thermoclostridium sp.]|nr:EAL domain-containing protein [Thermoclostridium sp.]